METFSLRHLLIGAAMIFAAIMSVVMTPTRHLASKDEPMDLDVMIPKKFENWKKDDSVTPIMPNPQQKAVLDKIYTQTLSRTYINDQGERVMLTIAYGSSQKDDLQVHRPEVCYSVQGFQVTESTEDRMHILKYDIPVRRMVAVNGLRTEPITYWITIGNKVVNEGLAWKIEQLKLGFHGIVPDGLLFRMSTISNDAASSYAIQNDFANALLSSLKPEVLKKLIGNTSK